jgi:hypothetical protein
MLTPAFFDNFGFIGFIFIGIVAVLLLLDKPIPVWAKIALLIVAILGCLVDGYIVVTNFIIKKK